MQEGKQAVKEAYTPSSRHGIRKLSNYWELKLVKGRKKDIYRNSSSKRKTRKIGDCIQMGQVAFL